MYARQVSYCATLEPQPLQTAVLHILFPVSLDFVEGQSYCRLGPCKSTLPCDILTGVQLTGDAPAILHPHH